MVSWSDRSKINTLLHEAMRLRDGNRCLRCHSAVNLQMSHIYPKGVYKKMMFDLDNVITLCEDCHFWWHENKPGKLDWLEETIGTEWYDRIRERARIVDKRPIDVDNLVSTLENYIASVNNA